MASESIHGMWSSRLMFILAAAGSAVGLGNIWRFPYLAGENGGGVFVLVYLGCIFLIGIPIMSAEILLGRAGRQSPINTMRDLTATSGANRLWQGVGWMGAIAGFMILSFYAVIAGWVISYIFQMGSGMFTGADADFVTGAFTSFTGNVWSVVGWHALFMATTIFITARGVGEGLETTVKYLMPALFVLLVVLLIYAATTSGHFMEGVSFLFSMNFEKFSWNAGLSAMGQAFFTLSLGMGAIMAYGAYMPEDASILGTATTIALLDTGVALMSGLIIFPLVFANGLESSAGPGLMFITLPLAFGQMAGRDVVAVVVHPVADLRRTRKGRVVAIVAIASTLGERVPVVVRLVRPGQPGPGRIVAVVVQSVTDLRRTRKGRVVRIVTIRTGNEPVAVTIGFARRHRRPRDVVAVVVHPVKPIKQPWSLSPLTKGHCFI